MKKKKSRNILDAESRYKIDFQLVEIKMIT